MKTLSTITLSTLIPILAIGCTSTEENDDYDPALLQEYRRAVPQMGQLEAKAPTATQMSIIGETATYPSASYDIVNGINGSIAGIVNLFDAITQVEPTLYNSETREFFWGPWENDDGIGYIGAYIREADGDFQYEYALLRGIDNDLANLSPIIWGGATPDPNNDDYGLGVTVWDFEANHAFEEAHNDNFANEVYDRGRFANLWGRGADENDPNAVFGFVVAVFRDFIPQDEPGAEATDLDYFYGRYEADGQFVDFIDWEAGIDVSEPADGLMENVGVRMAFFNGGTGRAEADAMGGSIEDGATWSGVECWDDAIARTYANFSVDGSNPASFSEGELANCGFFASTLTELEVPTLQDLDDGLLDALDIVAETGVPAP